MPKFVVTPDDREWFGRCRRAWDLGARGRRGLVPRHRPSDPTSAMVIALRAALAVHYFPGMWSWDREIVAPLVRTAYEQHGGPAAGREVLDGFLEWAPTVDHGTPVRVDADVDVHVPDPVLPDRHLATADGDAVRYRDRVDLVVVDEDDRSWLGEHRVVTDFADDDELHLDERTALACWAWDEVELATTIAGVWYTELRIDPPGYRRRVIARTEAEKIGAARRLARAVWDMIDPDVRVDPDPSWSHCSRCAFRGPCITLNRNEEPSFAPYEPRGPDVLEEGRLGGMSWGMGRGAAPPFQRVTGGTTRRVPRSRPARSRARRRSAAPSRARAPRNPGRPGPAARSRSVGRSGTRPP